jgi:hypothetical protein
MRQKGFVVVSTMLAAALVSCVEPEKESVEGPAVSSMTQSVLATCGAFAPFQGADQIVPEKELVVRDLSVVEDPCRTEWTTGCSPSFQGKWTFGWLMTVMSGSNNVTSPQARSFVASWLAKWLVPQTISPDPDPVAARPGAWSVLIKPWMVASGCAVPADTVTDGTIRANALLSCSTLDLKLAPFRLLGIVNRIDLDGRDYSGTTGAPGELRFVFGVINAATGMSVNSTVILEYQYPARFPPSWWAQHFHMMSTQPFGPSFAAALQSNITNFVTEPGAWPGKPNNGSAIGQIRTNENAFDSRPSAWRQWEFRQFALGCPSGTCNLAQVPVSQTPQLALNNSDTLTSFMTDNQTALASSTQAVTPTMLAGSALSAAGPNALVWNTSTSGDGHVLVNSSNPTLSYNVRHNMAFNTCTGCHYMETANQNQQFHLAPRPRGLVSPMSNFLTRTLNAGTTPMDYMQVEDPNPDSFDVVNGIPFMFQYNEIWRHACEVRRVMANVPLPFTTPTGH